MPPSLNFPQLDFVEPSSGFHPVTWERVTNEGQHNMTNTKNMKVAKVSGESSRSMSIGQKKKVICKDTWHCELVQKGNFKLSDIDGSTILTHQLVASIDASKPKFEPKIT